MDPHLRARNMAQLLQKIRVTNGNATVDAIRRQLPRYNNSGDLANFLGANYGVDLARHGQYDLWNCILVLLEDANLQFMAQGHPPAFPFPPPLPPPPPPPPPPAAAAPLQP